MWTSEKLHPSVTLLKHLCFICMYIYLDIHTPLPPLPDKAVVGAVMSAQALLLLHYHISAGTARPHADQHLQAAHAGRCH